MKALRCIAYGSPESLVVQDMPEPVPGPGEVVVRVERAAANYPDVLIVANRYQVSVAPPFTPGSEYAGVVEALGPGVTGRRVGEPVRGSSMVGAFAQRVVAAAGALAPIPEGFDMAAAASFGVAHGTAYHALRSAAGLVPGDSAGKWVVVLGAAGGVGLATVELAHQFGARVLAAASSPEKLAVCADVGAEALVDYEHEDLKERIRELTGGGADVVVDPVGGRYSEPALRATRWGARFVVVGFASGEIPRIPLNLVLLKGVVVTSFEMRTFSEHAPDLAARDAAELAELVRRGLVRPRVSATYPLGEAAAALRSLAERRATGKVVIDPWA